MKIKDLIHLDKKLEVCKWCNQTKKKFLKKNGYYWDIPSHSANEGTLLNNYEKDCVIAYIKNKYLTIFLIKTHGNYRGFAYLGEVLKNIGGTYNYTISGIYGNKEVLKFLKQDEENLIVVDKKEYSKFSKLLLLEELEK